MNSAEFPQYREYGLFRYVLQLDLLFLFCEVEYGFPAGFAPVLERYTLALSVKQCNSDRNQERWVCPADSGVSPVDCHVSLDGTKIKANSTSNNFGELQIITQVMFCHLSQGYRNWSNRS